MRKKMIRNLNVNEQDSYRIIDENDNIIEKFRTKACAINRLSQLQKIHLKKLRIVTTNEYNTKPKGI